MGFQTMAASQDDHHFLPLSRTLTLDELQTHLDGKPLGSMNLDDLLKNVCPSSSSSAAPGPLGLTNKTVDQVWTDIQGTSQEPLGQMTLEDFLLKAGIVSVIPTPDTTTTTKPASDLIASTTHAHWMHYPGPPLHHHPLPLPLDADTHIIPISSPLMPTLSPPRKRPASGDLIQKTVERRQKRMIKNRESAARSRARKQAYTNELENKVSRLEQENASLKEQRKKEILLPYVLPPPEPVVQLRRTSSARF